jgi:UDP-N-acetylmuramoyl-L-alanyl-D-glutamate--2,6-diaminopimelate ligase
VVAVTGTNGKTSVASFTRQIWERLGHRAVNIGTTGVEGSYSAPGIHTTPDALTLQSLLADIRADGIDRVSRWRRRPTGSTSAGWRRSAPAPPPSPTSRRITSTTTARWRPISTPSCGFSPSFCPRTASRWSISTIPTASGSPKRGGARHRGGRRRPVYRRAELKITGRRLDERGQDVLVEAWGKPIRVRLPLIGAFQAMNVMTAAGLVIAAGEEPDAVFAAFRRSQGRARPDATCRRPRQRRAGLCRLRPHAPTRWKPRSRRCARMCWAVSTSSSARAATATGASAR